MVTAYLVIVFGKIKHVTHSLLIQAAMLAIILQCQAIHPAFFVQVQQHLPVKKHVYLPVCTREQQSANMHKCFLQFVTHFRKKNKAPGMADPITHEKISHLTVTLVTPVCTMMYTIIKTNYSHSSANL